MLDAFIIEEIKRKEREAERRRDEQRPRIELPLPPSRKKEDEEDKRDKPDRGVIIIDYSVKPIYSEVKDLYSPCKRKFY